MPAAHRVRAKRVRDPSAFESDAWLGLPTDPRVSAVDSLTAQKRLVEAGLGVALLPESSFRAERRLGTLRTVGAAGFRPEQPGVAVRRRAGHRGALEEALRRALARRRIR